jgi:Cof subfamily protein (haloacid dehalogenase superfamily)
MNKTFPFKLAAIDIDDTLVGPDKQISLTNQMAVRQLTDLGCRVVLASGRRHDNMVPYARELNVRDYLISSGGAVTRHIDTGEILHDATLPVPDAPEVVADGLERGLTVLYWSAEGVFARQRSRWVEQYVADCKDPVTILDVESLAGQGTPPAEKVVWGAEPEVIAALAPQMRERYAGRMIVTVTDDWFMEFAAPGADKAAGVAAAAARYGIDRRHVLAFGDGNNDVPLLTWAGLGVAMSHGRPAARAAAGLVSPSGDPETELARAIDAVLDRAGFCALDEDACEVVEAA